MVENNSSKSVCLVDVMNSKSQYHCRHSVPLTNINEIKQYYAIESRVYNGYWDDDQKKYIKGPLWFTNYMVFDFDFKEEDFVGLGIDACRNKLKESMNKLFDILGMPKYIINNKFRYTEWQKKKYFTKNDVVKLPKRFGCQVVYELTESLQSQYVERVNLYRDLRLLITKLVNADINFKGHMFKNIYNNSLFDIELWENNDKVDIFKMSKKLMVRDRLNKYNNEVIIDMIHDFGPFETFKS